MTTRSDKRGGRPTPTQSRAARRHRRQRRRQLLRVAAFIGISVIAILFIASLFAGVLPISIGGGGGDASGERVRDQGRDHINLGEDHPPYNSTPATSGWHYDIPFAPTQWGVYDQPIPDEVLVHNLEHGGVGIHYDCPDGCEQLAADLEEIAQEVLDNGGEVVMAPYPDMDTRITLTAWTYIDKLDEFDDQRVREFISAHMNSSVAPEALAR